MGLTDPRFLIALVLGAFAGTAFSRLGTPLPWMLGPLVLCAICCLAGYQLRAPLLARRGGHWMIGTALGLYFTPEAAARLASLLPFVLIAAAYAVTLGLAFAFALRRWGGADPATAFFGGAIGGASEMASLGERAGASAALVSAGHALRITLVVSLLPFGYQWLGVSGNDWFTPIELGVNAPGLLRLLALTALAGWLASRLRIPNAWVLGPLFAAAAMSLAQWPLSALPTVLVNAGQLLIGVSLGSRFDRAFFRRGPRYLAVMAVTSLAGICVSALAAGVLSALSGVPLPTMILAMAPGGVGEMSLTAKLLQLGVPLVALFHVVRYVAVVMAMRPTYALLARRRGWPPLRPAGR